MFAIDNGLTFGEDYLEQFNLSSLELSPIPEDIKESLRRCFASGDTISILKDLLLELLPPKEVCAFLKRLEKLKMIIENGTIPRKVDLKFN